MSDDLDKFEDLKYRMSQQTEDTRTTHTFTYVFKVKGRWANASYQGTLANCNDAFQGVLAKRGATLDKVRWARGHMDDKRLVIHPKTDAEAEAEMRKVMSRSNRKVTVLE